MAPEVLKRNYKEKCDLWSAGVLLHFLVTGFMPFEAPNDLLLFDKIRKGNFNCPDGLSAGCLSLLHGLLNINPDERLSAAQALEHPWFMHKLPSRPITCFSLKNLERYSGWDSTQKSLVYYIATHAPDSDLLKEANTFLSINTSNTGILSKEEVERWARERISFNAQELLKKIKFTAMAYLGKIQIAR